MADNKKHHYVPRFYLKRFSSDGNSISLWNIKKKLKISSANLKHQCYKDYFYGKDLEAEKHLGLVEGETANIFRLIDRYNAPPRNLSEDHQILVLYMLMQHGRTTYSVDTMDEMNNDLMQYLMGPAAEAEGIDLSKFKIGIKDSAKYSVAMVTQFYPLVLDLEIKLLLNETQVDFVTSDNPVVLYNQFFSFIKHGVNTGLASKGLQMFLPISSKKMLMFYDSNVYSVGRISKSVVKITIPRDIYELNKLQMTSAYENVYYEKSDFDIESLYDKALPFRRDVKSKMRVFSREDDGVRRRELVASSKESIDTNLKLSFVNVVRKAKVWREKFRKLRMRPVVVVRDERLCQCHDEFIEKLHKGEVKAQDMFKFISERYESD